MYNLQQLSLQHRQGRLLCARACSAIHAVRRAHVAAGLADGYTTHYHLVSLQVRAQVRNWGSGQPADLGSLEVESFTPGAGGVPGEGGPTARAEGAKPAREPLFHEQLARRLAQLEVRLPA